MGKQSQEIRRLREDIATSKRQDGDADANDGGPQAVTLLVGNSLLRDVRVDKTSSGNPIKIRRKAKTLTPTGGRQLESEGSGQRSRRQIRRQRRKFH